MYHKNVYQDETVQYTEAFDPDDPTQYWTATQQIQTLATNVQRRLNNVKGTIKETREENIVLSPRIAISMQ